MSSEEAEAPPPVQSEAEAPLDTATPVQSDGEPLVDQDRSTKNVLVFADPTITLYEKSLCVKAAIYNLALGCTIFAFSIGFAANADVAFIMSDFGETNRWLIASKILGKLLLIILVGVISSTFLQVNLDIVMSSLVANFGLMGLSFQDDIKHLFATSDASTIVKYMLVCAYEVLPMSVAVGGLIHSATQVTESVLEPDYKEFFVDYYLIGTQIGAVFMMLVSVTSRIKKEFTSDASGSSLYLLLLFSPFLSAAVFLLLISTVLSHKEDLDLDSALRVWRLWVSWVLLAAPMVMVCKVYQSRFPSLGGPAFMAGNYLMMVVLLLLMVFAHGWLITDDLLGFPTTLAVSRCKLDTTYCRTNMTEVETTSFISTNARERTTASSRSSRAAPTREERKKGKKRKREKSGKGILGMLDTRMTPRRLPQKIVSSYVETLQGRAHVSSTERLAKTDLDKTLGGKNKTLGGKSKPPDDLLFDFTDSEKKTVEKDLSATQLEEEIPFPKTMKEDNASKEIWLQVEEKIQNLRIELEEMTSEVEIPENVRSWARKWRAFPDQSQAPAIPPASTEAGSHLPLNWFPPKSHGYPICHLKPMGKTSKLAVLDLAHIEIASYQPTAEMVRETMNNTFYGENYTIEKIEDATKIGRYITVYFPEDKLRVLAFRGTSLSDDWLANFGLVADIAVLQGVGYFVPVLNFIPESSTRRLIAFRNDMIDSTAKVYGPLLDYAKDLTEKNKDDELVIVGHSLGGLLASIVTAHLKRMQKENQLDKRIHIRSIVFSSPGVYYNRDAFGLKSFDEVQRSLINVIPDNDIVPLIDKQVGATQRINCNRRNAMHCHEIYQTVCELWRACGDPKGRDYRDGCVNFMTEAEKAMMSATAEHLGMDNPNPQPGGGGGKGGGGGGEGGGSFADVVPSEGHLSTREPAKPAGGEAFTGFADQAKAANEEEGKEKKKTLRVDWREKDAKNHKSMHSVDARRVDLAASEGVQ